MAERSFTINTDPHRAVVGGITLLFEPEVEGAVMAAAYAEMQSVQAKLKEAQGGGESVDPDTLGEATAAMRTFLDRFMLQESKPEFSQMKAPDRVLIQMIEFVTECYGSGSQGNDDGGPSSDS